jgi:rhamnosyltransferase subunit B
VLLCPHRCLPRGWGDMCHAVHCEYAPFGAILQHASAFVGNGGIGGFSQAVRAGVPMLVIPGGWDQSHNGWLGERLGVAAVVGWAGDGAAISRALSRLLSTPAVRERCEELRALSEDDGETGCQRGAWHILDWAAKRVQSAPAVAADA